MAPKKGSRKSAQTVEKEMDAIVVNVATAANEGRQKIIDSDINFIVAKLRENADLRGAIMGMVKEPIVLLSG